MKSMIHHSLMSIAVAGLLVGCTSSRSEQDTSAAAQPSTLHASPGTATTNVTFSKVATGAPPIFYQWRRGQTNPPASAQP